MSGTKRISALTELASGSVDEDDILVIVDMSQASVPDKTKHVKVKNLIAVGGRLEIDSFAELATKFVSASPSSTQQIAATNDIVVWREKGFRYQCVTSEEDFDYTGSGGLKWKALPGLGGYNVLAFGAAGDGTTDDTTSIQAAIDAAEAAGGGIVYFPQSTGSYLFSALTVTGDNIELRIEADANVKQTVIDGFGITISGDNCSISGEGSISADVTELADYATTGSGIARAIVKITGDDFTATGIAVNTPSRCGFFVENADNAKFIGLRGDGGYLLADYNPASTLNLYAIYFDPPTRGTMLVMGCSFTRYITPIASGNLSGSGTSSGTRIIGNSFDTCYDHACYLLSCDGVIVHGNYSVNVRKPFVVGGSGARVTNNVCIATGTSDSNHEIGFSLRDTTFATVTGNYLYGRGAYIDLAVLSSGDITDCIIENNTLISTAESSELSASIRIVSTATQCLRHRVARNKIKNISEYNASQGVITISGNNTYNAYDCVVEENDIVMTDSIVGLFANYADGLVHRRNRWDRSGFNAAGATICDVIYITNSDTVLSEENTYVYRTGGTNVTSRGVTIEPASCNNAIIRGERNAMTSGSLTAAMLIVSTGTDGIKTRNHYDLTTPLTGKVTLGSGTGSAIFSNTNIKSGSRIFITPANAGAAQQMSDYATNGGIYASEEAASSRWLLVTGDGTETGVSGDYFYEIDG